MCRGVLGPRPFLGRCASERGPRDAPSWRGASRRLSPAASPDVPREYPGAAGDSAWLNDGTATAANSLLASDPPRLPVEGVRDPEGFAFTAVSPFY